MPVQGIYPRLTVPATNQNVRLRAAQELGSKFDVREFHNFVLRVGPLPFHILERNLEQ
jgi:uncharacterized protein (DUF885 family)